MIDVPHAPPGYNCPFCAVVGAGDAPWPVQADVVWRTEETTARINPRWCENNPGAVVVVPNGHVPARLTTAAERAPYAARVRKALHELGETAATA